jgi:glycerophosphoryl diester phosphodiesterase
MIIIGHRGARGLAPENTIAGLQKGLEHHVDELEFDLRVTKDNVVILSHDPELHDAAGNPLTIAAHTYEELKAHKPDLATFDEVLDTIGHPVPLHVEIKHDINLADVDPIVAIFKHRLAQEWKPEHFRIASRSVPILRHMQAEFPQIERVVIELWSGVRATWKARQVATHRISMLEYWLWTGFIAGMKRSGYELYAFPLQSPDKERFWAKLGRAGIVNNPKKAERWAKHGLAGIFTDFPDRFEK